MNQRKTLIVEGSVTQRSMLKDMVAKEGYEAVESATGADATARLRALDIDAVLVNWELADARGPELCRRWHESGEFDLIPFLILTSHTDAEHLRDSLDAGATDFIRKPPDQVELSARLRSALRMRDPEIQMNEDPIRDALTGLYNRRQTREPSAAIAKSPGFPSTTRSGCDCPAVLAWVRITRPVDRYRDVPGERRREAELAHDFLLRRVAYAENNRTRRCIRIPAAQVEYELFAGN